MSRQRGANLAEGHIALLDDLHMFPQKNVKMPADRSFLHSVKYRHHLFSLPDLF
jgi:hypothetical protein